MVFAISILGNVKSIITFYLHILAFSVYNYQSHTSILILRFAKELMK